MHGQMMFQPLLISSFIEHAARYHGDTAIISKNTDGTILKNTTLNTNWQIQTESKIISSYLCYKAILKIPYVDRKGEARVNEITAWFAPSLPYSYGPKDYNGLPGLIVQLQERKTIYYAALISLTKDKEVKVDFPKGKTISEEEYTKKIMSIK